MTATPNHALQRMSLSFCRLETMKRYLPYLCAILLVGCGQGTAPCIIVDVAASGQMSINNRQVTREELIEYCKRQRENYGLRPVTIRGADDARHAEIRTAMHCVAVAGLGDIAYATSSYETRTFPRYMSSWEPGGDISPYGPSPDGTLYLILSADGCDTESLLAATADTKVAIFCTLDSRHSTLVKVLQQCEAQGVETVYVGTL